LLVILVNGLHGTKSRWTEEEDSDFHRVFDDHLKQRKAASSEELETAILSILSNRSNSTNACAHPHVLMNIKQKIKLIK
jgi:hypothetical protein